MTQERNLLDVFKNESLQWTSEFSLNQIKIKREQVELIETKLTNIFGRDYFNISKIKNRKLENDNWIFYLLVNSNKLECILYLQEICKLISFIKRSGFENESIYINKIDEIKNTPDQLKYYFFEILIHAILSENNIDFTRFPVVNSIPLDALIHIDNIEYLVECRILNFPKKYAEILYPLMIEITKEIENNKTLFSPNFIAECELYNNELSSKEEIKQNLKLLLKSFDQNNVKEIKSDNYYLKLYPYNEADGYRIENQMVAENSFSIIHNPAVRKFRIYSKYSYRGKKKEELFKTIISKKRKQHKNSRIENKIFFFDLRKTISPVHPMFDNPKAITKELVEPKPNELFIFVFHKVFHKNVQYYLHIIAGDNMNKFNEKINNITMLPL